MKIKIITIPILLAAIIWFFASCSGSKKATDQTYVIYPPPPDTARVQYLTSYSSSENATSKKSSLTRFVVGEDKAKPIKKPYGVAIRNGKIYICDSGLGGLEIIDLKKKSFDYFLPEGKGQLKLPLNCFVEDNGHLYVADGERMQVVVFNSEGSYVTSFGEAENFRPTDVFVFDDKIWVTNVLDNRVYVYQKGSYQLMYKIPEAVKGEEGYLFQPTNLFVDSEKVYVSDMGDFNVKIFTHDGKFIRSIGSHGDKVGQFVRPKGISVDKDSNIYVVDAGFENVQIFDKEGKLLLFFAGPYNGPGDLWLPAKVVIDYDNLDFFRKYVDPEYDLKYLILVTSQFGPDKLNIYGAVELKK
jgi:DNA-binding beta-propeller fold protein YncE